MFCQDYKCNYLHTDGAICLINGEKCHVEKCKENLDCTWCQHDKECKDDMN